MLYIQLASNLSNIDTPSLFWIIFIRLMISYLIVHLALLTTPSSLASICLFCDQVINFSRLSEIPFFSHRIPNHFWVRHEFWSCFLYVQYHRGMCKSWLHIRSGTGVGVIESKWSIVNSTPCGYELEPQYRKNLRSSDLYTQFKPVLSNSILKRLQTQKDSALTNATKVLNIRTNEWKYYTSYLQIKKY